MMDQVPDGLTRIEWEAENLDDISPMDQPSEIIDTKLTIDELDQLIDEHQSGNSRASNRS